METLLFIFGVLVGAGLCHWYWRTQSREIRIALLAAMKERDQERMKRVKAEHRVDEQRAIATRAQNTAIDLAKKLQIRAVN